jgi:hypothetical protein
MINHSSPLTPHSSRIYNDSRLDSKLDATFGLLGGLIKSLQERKGK